MPQWQAQPAEEPAIQEFIEWVHKNRITGTLGSSNVECPFMPFPLLESHLRTPGRLHRILTALFPESHILPINTEEIWRLGIVRIFAIFILIGQGRYIKTIAKWPMLADNYLPFLSEPLHFPRLADQDTSIWSAFYEKQFQFSPHRFVGGVTDTELEDNTILPIVEKDFISRGGSAEIYRIKLHAKYDDLLSKDQPAQHLKTRPANTYILKTYNTKDAHVYYTNEKTAFKELALRKHNGESLVTFYGSFIWKGTFNVILEFADRGTLEDYFHTVPPPTTAEDILRFWQALFEVIKALCNIHQLKPAKDVPTGLDILQGWHQDIDPTNILVFSGESTNPYHVEFKLADLGLSHFRRVADMDGEGTDRDAWGTREYGAPECYRWDNFIATCELHTKPYVDIWSFGCVCSEAAVWVVLGKAGVEEYRRQRLAEVDNLEDFRDGAAFHDSDEVLKSVTDMHERLQEQSMRGDHVTRKVLSEMVASMLEITPEGRPIATQLEKTSQRILKAARKNIQSSVMGNSSVTGASPAENALTPPPGGTQLARPDITSFVSEPLPSASALPPASLEKTSQNPRAMTISVPKYDSGGTNFDLSYGNTASLSPPYTPTKGRHHGRTLVDEPLACYPEACTPTDGKLADLSQPNDPHTPPTSKRSNSKRTSGYHGLETSLSQQHRRNLTGSSISPSSGQANTALNSNPLWSHMYTSHIEAQGTASAPPISEMSPDRPQRSRDTAKPRPPRLSFDQAVRYKTEHKEASRSLNLFSRRDLPPFVHEGYLNDLNQRDHVFLIDDSHSMKEHWSDVKDLFNVLAWLVKRKDDDGFDLCFTVSSQDKDKNFTDTKPALKHLSNIKPAGMSNINKRLGDVLGKYNLRRKALSLYVFTDGIWQHGSDGIAPIRNLVEHMNRNNLPKERVGIQFIQFGNDLEGTRRLAYLDSGLGKAIKEDMIAADPAADIRHRVWDIVDTEPFEKGDVMKMLLGAVNSWFDNDEDGVSNGRDGSGAANV